MSNEITYLKIEIEPFKGTKLFRVKVKANGKVHHYEGYKYSKELKEMLHILMDEAEKEIWRNIRE